ncbi:MAG: hypothetical protein ACAH59_07440 [Pseudobdellovibrionaceae bacterium]
MSNLSKTDRYYRVVRYHSEFGLGVVEDVLGNHLTRDEAEKIARENPPVVSDEEIEIEEDEVLDFGSSVRTDS